MYAFGPLISLRDFDTLHLHDVLCIDHLRHGDPSGPLPWFNVLNVRLGRCRISGAALASFLFWFVSIRSLVLIWDPWKALTMDYTEIGSALAEWGESMEQPLIDVKGYERDQSAV